MVERSGKIRVREERIPNPRNDFGSEAVRGKRGGKVAKRTQERKNQT